MPKLYLYHYYYRIITSWHWFHCFLNTKNNNRPKQGILYKKCCTNILLCLLLWNKDRLSSVWVKVEEIYSKKAAQKPGIYGNSSGWPVLAQTCPAGQPSSLARPVQPGPAQAAWPSKPGPAQYTKNQDTVASIYFIHFEERLSGCLCV